MFITVKTAKKKRYVQIAESYRGDDGKPTHRVLFSLGQLSDREIENWRTLLAANRAGKTIVMAEGKTSLRVHVRANFRFADVAVALKFCELSGVREILNEVVAASATTESIADVLVSLVVQRSVDPRSKFGAVSWFRETALPELLEFDPDRFNNSRLHRALNALHRCTGPLKEALRARRAQESPESLSTLFVDLTDTWFEGRGPDLAKKRKTKLGHVRRKIGIAMLCDYDGYPLDWEVVEGNEAECDSLCRMVKSHHERKGSSQSTYICDRALGKTSLLTKLAKAGVQFIIPITKDQFESYGATYGVAPRFDGVDGTVSHDDLGRIATEAGMTSFCHNGYVIDLDRVTPCKPSVHKGEILPLPEVDPSHPLRSDLRLAMMLENEAESGESSSFSHAAGKRGLVAGPRSRLQALVKLIPAIRDRIEAGEGATLSTARLVTIAGRASTEQLALFEIELKRAPLSPPKRRPRAAVQPKERATHPPEQQFRCVACFNPDLFKKHRTDALAGRDGIQQAVQAANDSTKLSLREKRTAVERALRSASLFDSYDVHTSANVVTATLKPDVWRRNRRRDGFSVLVAHPETTTSAAELARLYRQRNRIERDFQTIKSVVRLRPVRHHTDAKVDAHVTLCILALWVLRALDQQLQRAGAEVVTGACALDLLATCHLNLVDLGAPLPIYTLTTPTAVQARVLAALGLAYLGDDEAVSPLLTPR